MKALQEQRARRWRQVASDGSKSAEVGDVILLRVDYREKRALDPSFLPAVVMFKTDKNGLRCAHNEDGMLKGVYFLGDACCSPKGDISDVWGMQATKAALLAIATDPSNFAIFDKRPKISLGVAIRSVSAWGKSREIGLCGCDKSKCNSKTCSCFKNGLFCGSKCHRGTSNAFNHVC